MVKRDLIFILLMLFLSISLTLININFVHAHHESDVSGQVVGEIPAPAEKISGSLGEIDPNTGLPKKFSEYKEKADEFRYSEQNKSYLAREWTKILAKNKVLGPILFYTDKFFSILNPLWKAIFEIEFSWSWSFFLSFFIWILFIVLVYYPLQGILKNSLVDVIVSIIVASLIGVAGAISEIVWFFDLFVKNIFILIILIIIIILFLILYSKYMRAITKYSEEEELERAKEKTRAFGKVAGEELEELGR